MPDSPSPNPTPGPASAPYAAPPGTAPAPTRPATATDWRRLHLWQIQPVRDLLVIASIVALVYLGFKVRIVTTPLLVALLMAYLFEPLVRRLTRSGRVGRQGVVLGIIAAFVLAVLVPLSVALTFAVFEGVNFAGALAGQIRTVQQSVENPGDAGLREQIQGKAWRNIRDWLVQRRREAENEVHDLPAAGAAAPDPARPAGTPSGAESRPDDGPPAPAERDTHTSESPTARLLRTVMSWTEANAAGIAQTLGKTAVGSGAQAVAVALATLGSIGALLFKVFLTLFFFFFLSTGWGRVLERGRSLIPDSGRMRWLGVIQRMDRAIAGFVRGRLTIAAIIGVYMTLAMWFIGVPAPFLIGPAIGALFLIPFAAMLAVPVVMLLLWLQGDATGFRGEWWWIVLAPIGVHVIGQVLDDYILSPRIQGENTDLGMASILFASIAGGALAGVYGLLLAIPVAACIKILANEFLWPRVGEWVRGRAQDPLPISTE